MKTLILLCAVGGGSTGFFYWLAGQGYETVALIANCAIWGALIMISHTVYR
jgi:hypothetical protein